MLRLQFKLKRMISSLKMLALFWRYTRPNISTYGEYQVTDLYREFDFNFRFASPKYLRRHRAYFKKNKRGFGEDAFHAAWLYIFKKYSPVNCLEIGVYRGQIISLWALISQNLNSNSNIWGLTPLIAETDSVSEYAELEYLQDIENNFSEFQLSKPQIIRGLSTDQDSISRMKKTAWDLIYIDGGHDFDVVLSDYQNAKSCARQNAIICFDDSSLYFSTEGAFKGHPGPSRVVTEYALKEMSYLFTVGHLNFFQKI